MEEDGVPAASQRDEAAADAAPAFAVSDARREEIRKEEEIRAEMRRELEARDAPPPFRWRGMLQDRAMATTILTVIVIPFVIWLVGQIGVAWTQAETARLKAETERNAAAQRILAEQRADITQMTPLIPYFALPADDRARLVALRVLGALRRARESDLAVADVFQTASDEGQQLLASTDAAQRAQGRQISEALAPPASGVTVAAPPPSGDPVRGDALDPSARPGRVYIQIYGEDQRALATTLREALQRQDVPVPGIENVVQTHGGDARRFAQQSAIGVRYYRAEDRAGALFTAGIIAQAVPGHQPPRLQDLSGRSGRAAPGVIEVWLPCGAAEGCGS
ncbi:MAG: hypothetical protein JO276_04260 [Sphingomonadaceae bacterium]|nr:hypothetical protein [Sphingomonadaceae bacterium]